MRFNTGTLLLATAFSGVTAAPQAGASAALSALTECAQAALENLAQSVACTWFDLNCMCNQPSILDRIKNTVNGQCGNSDAAATFAINQCSSVGVNLNAVPASNPAQSTTTTIGSATVTSTLLPATATSIAPVTMNMTTPYGNSSWSNTTISPSAYLGGAKNVKMGGIAAGLLGVAVAFAML